MRTFFRFAAYFVAASLVLVACAKQGGSQGGGLFGGNNAPQSTFPLISPNTVVTTGTYDDSPEIEKLGSGMFGTGGDEYKPYIGSQELIKTSASLDDLRKWLHQLVQTPPQDLVPTANTVQRDKDSSQAASPAPAETGSPSASASPASGQTATPMEDPFANTFQTFGLVPIGFYSKDRGRVVLVMVMDPKAVADHLGPTMDLMDQYEKLPALMRGGIDDLIKKNTGMSISDLMNTNTPMGMIVYAARNYKNEDTRAIVLVDALRQPNPLPTPHATGT
jgi:hypothetical protein